MKVIDADIAVCFLTIDLFWNLLSYLEQSLARCDTMSASSVNLCIIFNKGQETWEECPFTAPYNEQGSMTADFPSICIVFKFYMFFKTFNVSSFPPQPWKTASIEFQSGDDCYSKYQHVT